MGGPEQRGKTLCVLCSMLVAVFLLVASALVVSDAAASCRAPLQLGPAPGDTCNGHACAAEISDIIFRNGNCSDRSTLEYCFLDVKERLFYEEAVCLQSELTRGVRVFFVEAHLQRGRLRACHRWCTAKLEGVEDMLSVFSEFLRLNPREVLILWWFPAHGSHDIHSEMRRLYVKSGLAPFEFVPTQSKWPAIGELVQGDTRLVSLSDAPSALRRFAPGAPKSGSRASSRLLRLSI